MKNCQFCNGEIEDDAKKCKHCGEWVNKTTVTRDFAPTVAFAFFFGFLGVHRFYTGYRNIGIAQLVLSITLIGLIPSMIWSLVDTICICLNKYNNANGKPLSGYNKTFGIIILVISILCFIFNCANFIDGAQKTESSRIGTSNAFKDSSKDDLEILEHHVCTLDFGVKGICGTLQNNSNKAYSYVQISANFYDKSGTQVGDSMTNATNLEPNGKLKFEIVSDGNNVSSYKITEVTGW